MSHELRTPASAVHGYTDLLLEGAYGDLNPDQREIVSYMKESAGSLMGMIDNLLSLTLMNRGQTDLVLRTFLVEEVIRDVLMTCRTDYERKRLSVSFRVNPPDLCIRSDFVKLQQILINLVVNAIRYTDTGWIQVHARKVTGKPGKSEMFELEVSDSGRGISDEDQRRIFQRFFRGTDSSDPKGHGMGLGLYIVKSLVRVLDGNVRVKSKLGEGTSFTVTMPVEFEEAKALQNLVQFNQAALAYGKDPRATGEASNRIVVFLGGDANRCRLLGENLRPEGIVVEPVESLDSLIEKVGSLHPVAIFLDPEFAIPSGGDVLQDLKLNPATTGIPVLFFMESMAVAAAHGTTATSAQHTPQPARPTSSPPSAPRSGKHRVLITDDDPGMREALQVALESEGYDVLLAADGQEGLRLLAEQHPDLMLLDLMMPGLNGWQVIDILAQKPELRDTKVLMLTGAALSAEEAQKLKDSTGGLLRKDEFKLNQILAGIARAIGRQ